MFTFLFTRFEFTFEIYFSSQHFFLSLLWIANISICLRPTNTAWPIFFGFWFTMSGRALCYCRQPCLVAVSNINSVPDIPMSSFVTQNNSKFTFYIIWSFSWSTHSHLFLAPRSSGWNTFTRILLLDYTTIFLRTKHFFYQDACIIWTVGWSTLLKCSDNSVHWLSD